MKNYVIMYDVDGIRKIDIIDKEKHDIKSIKEQIEKWTDGKKPEIIEDKKTIEILNFVYRFNDDHDLQRKYDNLFEALADINTIIERTI